MSDGRIPIGIFGVHVETLWPGLRTEICRTEKICTGRIWTHSWASHHVRYQSIWPLHQMGLYVQHTIYVMTTGWLPYIEGGVFAAYRMWPKIKISYITRCVFPRRIWIWRSQVGIGSGQSRLGLRTGFGCGCTDCGWNHDPASNPS